MKIIQNNYDYNKIPTEEYICETCNSIFQYENYDVYTDKYGDNYVNCPCCGHKCIVEEKTTEDNINFPKNFYEFGGANTTSVDISNDEITNRIQECIKWLKANPNEPFKYIGYGNMFLCVFNHEDEYYIIVTKNYFDVSIDK